MEFIKLRWCTFFSLSLYLHISEMQTLSDLISRDELMVPQIFSSFSRFEIQDLNTITSVSISNLIVTWCKLIYGILANFLDKNIRNEAFLTKNILEITSTGQINAENRQWWHLCIFNSFTDLESYTRAVF